MNIEKNILQLRKAELLNSILEYSKLLNVQYNFVVAYKGKTENISLTFKKENSFHLLGLHYLKDVRYPTKNKEDIFDIILNKDSFREKIASSKHYDEIKSRIVAVSRIADIIENDSTALYRFVDKGSNIKADYMFKFNDASLKEPIFFYIQREKSTENTYTYSL